MRLPLAAASALLAALALPAAQGHNVYEAQELEIHLLNDEGSDTIEAYGGYDITEVFLGAAYVPGMGDALYFRLEAYGLMTETNSALPWSLRLTFEGPAGPVARTVSTADGVTFDSDFDAIQLEVEERDLHVQRAYLLLRPLGMQPGDVVRGVVVESFFGDDLRDVAPGGIPVPGSGGLVEYPDPTQIDGKGRLVEEPRLPSPEAYFGDVRARADGITYTLEVDNPLTAGGQHFFLRDADATQPGWNITVIAGAESVAANGTATFQFTAQPGPGATPRALELVSDVGGRLPFFLEPDGVLFIRDLTVRPPPPVEAPLPLPLVAIGLAAVAAAARARRSPVA